MLDIGWPELTVILVVALLVIGPRDLPKALHSVGKWVRKARSITREFQRHIDDMVRDADIEEVKQLRQHAGKFSKAGMTRELDKMIDPSGEMRQSMDVKKAFAGKPDEAGDGSAEAAADGQAVAAAAATDKAAAPKTDAASKEGTRKAVTPTIESKPAVPMADPGPAAAARTPAGKPAEPRQPRAAKPRSTASRTTKPRAAKAAGKEPTAKAAAKQSSAKQPSAKPPAARKEGTKKGGAKKDGAAAKTATASKAPAAETAAPKRRTRRKPPAAKPGAAEPGSDTPAVSAKPAATKPSAGAAAPADRDG